MGDVQPTVSQDPYAAYEATADGVVAEVIGGVLHVQPAPSPMHSRVIGRLYRQLGGFDGGDAPGGWQIFIEPEIRFARFEQRPQIVVPDIAGWRVERLPTMPTVSHFSIEPNWVCEVLSPSTARKDRATKMPLYAAEGVANAWLVDPALQTVESYRLVDGYWLLLAVLVGDERVRVEPFESVELDLATLWASR